MTLSAWLLSPHWDDDPPGRRERSNKNAPTSPAIDPADHAILDRLRAGDSTALSEVYHDLFPDLVRFAFVVLHSRDLAEEVVQDVFTAVWTRRETLAIHGSLRGYFFTSVRYRALNARRAEHTAQRFDRQASDAIAAPALVGPEEALLTAEEAAAIHTAVAALNIRQRQAVTLRMQNQLTYDEIATVLGISADAARMLVNRALSELRKLLADFLTE